jgi:hypothetical protein
VAVRFRERSLAVVGAFLAELIKTVDDLDEISSRIAKDLKAMLETYDKEGLACSIFVALGLFS